jgi:hypothetical protein
VGGLFQLFRPINEAIKHFGKRGTTVWARTRPEWIHPPRAKRFAPVLTTEWNKIHGVTCATDEARSVISECTDDNTCFLQWRFILACVAVVILLCSFICACICCPCCGLVGC